MVGWSGKAKKSGPGGGRGRPGGAGSATGGSGGRRSPRGHAQVMTGPHPALLQVVALLPLVAAYELAVPLAELASGRTHCIDVWSRDMLAHLGLTGYYLPGLLILLTLLAVHFVKGEPWHVEIREVGGVWLESLFWLVPLVVLTIVFTMPWDRLMASAAQQWGPGLRELFSNLVMSIGAGLFEEFIFRLVLISAALFVLQRICGVPVSAAQVVAVLLAATLFSAAHHVVLGNRPYTPLEFLFRVGWGIYIGIVYIIRGLATATIVHAMFDIYCNVASAL